MELRWGWRWRWGWGKVEWDLVVGWLAGWLALLLSVRISFGDVVEYESFI